MTGFDAIILDGMLPVIDGLHVLAELRRLGGRCPVLLLTVRTTVDERVTGLEASADDYLTKPFAELLARLRALLRRPPLQADQLLLVGSLEFDPLQGVQ